MRFFSLGFLLFFANTLWAQHENCSSTFFSVNGAVKRIAVFDWNSLDSFNKVKIPDITITNHKGEKKSAVTGLQGILLKDIFQKISFTIDEPKKLSELYFVFTACDGYKVVYSWNEIFNSSTGNNLFIVTDKEGIKGINIKESILAVTTSDFTTGRRYIKGLSTITVKQAE